MRQSLLLLLSLMSVMATAQDIVQDRARPLDSTKNLIEDTSLLTVIGVGDIMLGTNYPDVSYLPPHDGRFLLDSVKHFLLNADLTFGNLEGTYLNSGGKVKKCGDPKICYAFRSPEHYLEYIRDAGFDLLSLANNHSGDFGPDGRINTQNQLDKLKLNYAGLESCPFTVFVKDSIRYGLAAFAPNTGCMDVRDIEAAVDIVKHLDSMSDIIIISFHGGAEGSKYQNVGKGTEMFLGENRGNLREFSHRLIDAGADIIFGHGPHVTRALELYKGRIVAYSLGNFATYGRFNLKGPNGVCPILRIQVNGEGEFVQGLVIPVRQIGEGIPVLDTGYEVIRILQKLTKEDFPQTPLEITDEGLLLKKAEAVSPD